MCGSWHGLTIARESTAVGDFESARLGCVGCGEGQTFAAKRAHCNLSTVRGEDACLVELEHGRRFEGPFILTEQQPIPNKQTTSGLQVLEGPAVDSQGCWQIPLRLGS